MKWIVTGDTHAHFERFFKEEIEPNTAFLVLGDVGLNFYLRKKDWWNKSHLSKLPAQFYCVKGNHEARPSTIAGMKLCYDPEVQGEVWMEEEFPNIKYFKEWGVYTIDGKKTLVIGGAYSVDKFYRLKNGLTWFADEQLTAQEMKECLEVVKGQSFDLVLSHTCPFTLQPAHLFMSCVDESTVDNTMELWLQEVADSIDWGIWLFGHFHEDELIAPHVEMLYFNMVPLQEIVQRWKDFDETSYLDYTLQKSPTFYWHDKKN